MGYTTQFEGKLEFTSPLTAEQELALNAMWHENPDDHPEWIVSKPKSYIQLEITKDKTGIEWDGSEKFYYATEGVNTVIDTMRKTFPDFGLKGALLAQGEEVGDVWRLVIEDGRAVEKTINVNTTECPDCGHKFVA